MCSDRHIFKKYFCLYISKLSFFFPILLKNNFFLHKCIYYIYVCTIGILYVLSSCFSSSLFTPLFRRQANIKVLSQGLIYSVHVLHLYNMILTTTKQTIHRIYFCLFFVICKNKSQSQLLLQISSYDVLTFFIMEEIKTNILSDVCLSVHFSVRKKSLNNVVQKFIIF